MKLDGARLGLALGLGLLPVLILAGRVAPLTRGRGYRARLGPRGDGGRRWCRGRRYRDIGKGAQAGRRRAQGHRTRRRRQWKEGRRWTVRLTRLLTEIVAFFTAGFPINRPTSLPRQFMGQYLTSDVNLFLRRIRRLFLPRDCPRKAFAHRPPLRYHPRVSPFLPRETLPPIVCVGP